MERMMTVLLNSSLPTYFSVHKFVITIMFTIALLKSMYAKCIVLLVEKIDFSYYIEGDAKERI